MNITQQSARPLAIALIFSILTGCDTGGARSSGSAISVNDPINDPVSEAPVKAAPANAVDITPDNVQTVASSTLKAALLSDISTSAVNRTVNITQEQNAQISDLATGVVITMQPVNCLYGGLYTLQATFESTDEDIQIDFAENLSFAFNTAFEQCNQGFIRLDGSVGLAFDAVVNDWLAQNNFTLNTNASINQLTIEQTGYAPFVVNGSLNFAVYNPDAENMVVEVTTNDMYFSADNTYQIVEYESYKNLHLPSGSYEITIYSQFVDQNNDGSLIEYQTIEPLRGQGTSVPHSGKLMIFGATDTMEITVIDTQSIELAIDYGNDNIIDETRSLTWFDLAISDLQFN